MYSPFALFVGLRYTQAKRRNQFISFVSLISLLGMMLGVFSLIVVLSVMNGFEAELRGRILSVVPHGFITRADGRLDQWREWIKPLEINPEVIAAAPFIEGNVMVSRPGMVRGAKLQAIDPLLEAQVSDLSESLVAGEYTHLKSGEYGILIGNLLARHLGVSTGDKLSVVLPKVTITPLGVFPRVKRFTVVGIFSVGAQLDSDSLFIHLHDGQKLFQYGENVDGVRVKLTDLFQAPKVLAQLVNQMPQPAKAKSWQSTQGTLFQAMKMEKTMVTLLLLIIVAIAAFNIISILTMMVADKRSDIAVLRTMGATPATIMRIFMIQGVAVGSVGIVIGTLLALPVALHVGDIVSWFESLLGLSIFNPQIYFISEIPSVVKLQDIVMVTVSGLILSGLATLYPSIRAASVQPADVLRYE